MAVFGNKNKEMPNMKGIIDDQNDIMMGVMMSQNPGNHRIDLMQNCDLPTPTKVFSGSSVDKTVINCFTDKEKALTLKNNHGNIDDQEGKMGLLEALRLSQTRAREAQAKCEAVVKERNSLALALMEDSMRVFAYRQLVRLLEFQVSTLQKKQVPYDCGQREGEQEEEEEDGSGNGGLTWIIAVAFVLGIAGFGFAFDWKYY